MKVISDLTVNKLKKVVLDKSLKDISNEAFSENKVIFKVHNSQKGEKNLIQLKIFSPNSRLSISSIFPMIDNLGLLLIDLETLEININHHGKEKKLYVHNVRTQPKFSELVLHNNLCFNLEEGLEKIWSNNIENDTFNSLILYIGFNYREVVLLRAYTKYLSQINFPFSTECILKTLVKYSDLTRNIVKLFDVRFYPSLDNRAAEEKRLRTAIDAQLSKISIFDDDKILATYLNVILATKRTNFFVTGQDSQYRDFISLKIYSKEVKDMPLPKPEIDTFVYSAKFEAIHLRGGKVARGGIRWADSLENFRKVILDLTKGQMTKNALTVPSGAKGGFFVKQNSEDQNKEDYFKYGIECYKNFLRGVLDITDNIINEKIIPPQNVVRHDEDDPYFVVAADKGTATFSDFANEVAKEYNFWLGDAFASGGSTGYDHKEMGITAKGAWVCVQEHLKKISIDTNKDIFTAVGIGDMSGDVFGNGMLLSRKMKLLAAFNHIHIFIDPNPDPETSFKERKRLFKKPGSKWSDYNKDLISKGGGVYERSEKSISISSEVKKALGIIANHLSPSELIKAVLKAPVDLLWNGGIGTYVKGEDEKDSDIGDRANDSLRVLGQELRCKVVGEGGNLGFTQKGRIEYAKKGSRINTDSIDNSGGVNCSDREVNIKIALEYAVQTGNITFEERNKILKQLAKEVEELVLQDNYKQSVILDIECSSGINSLKDYAWLINYLEEKGELQREVESLPTQKEIERMNKKGKRLTRPEIAILIAYAKNSIAKILNSHDFIKDTFFQNILLSYFPKYLQEDFKEAILLHKLNNEIVVTIIANEFVNTLGCTTFHLLMEEGGYDPAMIIKVFYVVMKSTGMHTTIKETLHYVSNATFDKYNDPKYFLSNLYSNIINNVSKGITWFLMNYPYINDIDAMSMHYKKGIHDLKDSRKKRLYYLVEGSEPLRHNNTLFAVIMIQSLIKNPLHNISKVYHETMRKLCIDQITALAREDENVLGIENKNLDYIERLANNYIENELGKLATDLVLKQLKKKNEKGLDFLKDTKKLEQFRSFVIRTIAKKDGKNNFILMTILINKLKELLKIDNPVACDETP